MVGEGNCAYCHTRCVLGTKTDKNRSVQAYIQSKFATSIRLTSSRLPSNVEGCMFWNSLASKAEDCIKTCNLCRDLKRRRDVSTRKYIALGRWGFRWQCRCRPTSAGHSSHSIHVDSKIDPMGQWASEMSRRRCRRCSNRIILSHSVSLGSSKIEIYRDSRL